MLALYLRFVARSCARMLEQRSGFCVNAKHTSNACSFDFNWRLGIAIVQLCSAVHVTRVPVAYQSLRVTTLALGFQCPLSNGGVVVEETHWH